MIEMKTKKDNVERTTLEEIAAQVATAPPHPATTVDEQVFSQEEALRQFTYVQRLTRAFLSVTWLVLIGYLIKTGVAWQDGVMVGLFLVVTYQLWNITPGDKK